MTEESQMRKTMGNNWRRIVFHQGQAIRRIRNTLETLWNRIHNDGRISRFARHQTPHTENSLCAGDIKKDYGKQQGEVIQESIAIYTGKLQHAERIES